MSTTQDSSVQAAPTPAPKKQIRISAVLDMLKDGKDREEIAKELGLTPAERRAVFSHKDVMRKKVRKPVELGIEIIDLEDEGESGDAPVVETPQEEVVLPQTPVEVPAEPVPAAAPVTPEPQPEAQAPFMSAFTSPAPQAVPAPQPATSGWD